MSSEFIPKIVAGKFMHITDKSWELENKKKMIFFLSAGFCPYCAVERWAIVEALKNFGDWEILTSDKSSSTKEKYVNIPTFDFSRSKFSSKHIEFYGREIADRSFNEMNLLSKQDEKILDMYNPDKIIPFLLIDGQFMQTGTKLDPRLFENQTSEKITKLIETDKENQITKEIRDQSNIITALICKSIGEIPEAINEQQQITDIYKKI